MEKLKQIWKDSKNEQVWILILLLFDGVFGVCLWLADVRSFRALCILLGMASLGLFGAGLAASGHREKKKIELLKRFVEDPEATEEEAVLLLASSREREMIRQLGQRLREQEGTIRDLKALNEGQEEYVETWAHEMKNTLSLVTFVLENRKEEMSDGVYSRMEYSRNRFQEYIEQILHYERLKAEHKDYVFERVRISDCLDEVLSEYRFLLEEKKFGVTVEIGDAEVLTDKKSLEFILCQIISNTLKYAGTEKEPMLQIKAQTLAEGVSLLIQDNGSGVRKSDLPFIFEKGFVGDIGENRRHATGMGLYLVKQMAEELKVQVEVKSEYGSYFEVGLRFPVV